MGFLGYCSQRETSRYAAFVAIPIQWRASQTPCHFQARHTKLSSFRPKPRRYPNHREGEMESRSRRSRCQSQEIHAGRTNGRVSLPTDGEARHDAMLRHASNRADQLIRRPRRRSASSTLGRRCNRDPGGESDGYNSDTLDPDFLAALPEEMRQEIMNEHRRKRLAKKGGLITTAAIKKRRPPDLTPLGQRKIRLPPRQPRPTFTTQELSTLPELRDTLSEWYREFADDGPHPDDVAAMERYLRRVILDERDMSKVLGVVKWLEWLIDEADEDNEGTKIWSDAFDGIKEKVQLAVRERGLGKLEI